MVELWDLYDRERRPVGLTAERGKKFPPGDYFHIVIHVWIRNSRGEYLMSRRHPGKPFPLLWECTGGCILAGESSREGAIREVREELGLTFRPEDARLIHTEVREAYRDFYDAWLIESDSEPSDWTLQSTEVIDARWMKPEEIVRMFESKQIIKTLYYYDKVFAL